MWEDGEGRVMVVFGDTYGEGWCGDGAGTSDHSDWRCNVLATSTNRDLDNGLLLYSVVSRDDDGIAGQILERDPKVGKEETVIPTSGIAVGGRHYLHYMSVKRWGAKGAWETNYAGIAVSSDGGHSWTKPPGARWANTRRRDHPFQMGAFARQGYNVHFGQWIGLHHDEARAAIVLRTADELTGPWTPGQIVVSGRDFPGLYGGFLHPDSASGPTIYYA